MKAILLGGAALSLATVSAFGADLGVPAPAPVAVPFTWTSCYAGGQVGGGFGQKDLTDTAGVLAPTTGFTAANLDISGYVVGGQIGCDYQLASGLVLGIEGSAAGGALQGNVAVATPGLAGDSATYKETTDLLTSATARVGYAWGNWLPYIKGGAAWASDKYNAFDTLATYNLLGEETRFGWTAGAGIEWAFCKDWSVKLEYDYYGFGQRNVTFVDSTISGAVGPENIKQNIQVILVGLNFHFSGWQTAAPSGW